MSLVPPKLLSTRSMCFSFKIVTLLLIDTLRPIFELFYSYFCHPDNPPTPFGITSTPSPYCRSSFIIPSNTQFMILVTL